MDFARPGCLHRPGAHSARLDRVREALHETAQLFLDARIHELAGSLPPSSMRVDIPRLVTAYYTERPDASVADQRVAFLVVLEEFGPERANRKQSIRAGFF